MLRRSASNHREHNRKGRAGVPGHCAYDPTVRISRAQMVLMRGGEEARTCLFRSETSPSILKVLNSPMRALHGLQIKMDQHKITSHTHVAGAKNVCRCS